MSVTYIVFRQICVMALLIFLGWLLARKGIINKAGNGQISGILTYIITPCVIINAFVSLEANAESLLRLVQALAVFGAVFISATSPVGFTDALYEAVSALATVGLTAGATGALSIPAQILIVIYMYFGRVGVLTISLGFLMGDRAEERFRYAETNLLIG